VPRQYYVYMMSNEYGNVLYVGITNNLLRRAYEHREGTVRGFSDKYKTKKLVFFEIYSSVYEAIAREKQIKGMRRQKKNDLVSALNPEWADLFSGLW
jgi:putative endonuclease